MPAITFNIILTLLILFLEDKFYWKKNYVKSFRKIYFESNPNNQLTSQLSLLLFPGNWNDINGFRYFLKIFFCFK